MRLLPALRPASGLLVLCISLAVMAARVSADDTVLFSANAPPNVMLLVDNSGSMANIVWHPAFDPDVDYACDNWDDDTSYSLSSTTSLSRCGNTRTLYHDEELGTTSTRYLGSYLNWLFSDDSDPYVSELASTTNGTEAPCADGDVDDTYGLYRRSRITAAKQILLDVICTVNETGEVRFGLAKFRATDAAEGGGSDPDGGFVAVPIDDYTDTQRDLLDAEIAKLEAESWTPLAETLFHVYQYFMSRSELPSGADGSACDYDGSCGTLFPAYRFDTSGGTATPTSSSVPDSPIQYACQRNFVVIITDGEPTKDDFDPGSEVGNTELGFDVFVSKLIGDFNDDGELEEPTPATDTACTGICNQTTRYLDDIAKFMHEVDVRPDLDGPDDTETSDDLQTLDIYTVGFTTRDFANDVLEKTAQQGNGLFFTSNSAEELTEAIVESVTDIIEKSRSFAAATVPAARTTEGSNFYFSSFVPSDEEAFWEGHLKNYGFSKNAEVTGRNDQCALANNGENGNCQIGTIDPTVPPHWDAGEGVENPDSSALPAAADRTLYVSLPGTSAGTTPLAFDTTNVSASDLDLSDVNGNGVADDIAAYSDILNDGMETSSDASTLEGLGDELVDYFRGCVFGGVIADGDCTDRSWRLGDIFHSNPVVVPAPNAVINDPSYFEFAQLYATRQRMIYAGANDGFLHAFNAGEFDSGASPPGYDRGNGRELFGFMPWQARENLRNQPLDSGARDVYFVDSSPQAADVWFYPSATSNGSAKQAAEWHTVLIGGMRQGGSQYYALDVTNPPGGDGGPVGGGPSFPEYLWEFPCEADTTACNEFRGFMGETWSEPVITRVRVGSNGNLDLSNGLERWVAIFGAGYAPEGDPNDLSSYNGETDSAATPAPDTQGRAIFILDVQTGEVIASKRFQPDEGGPESDMLFSLPSSPAVFDLNQDGFADVVYIGDLGGNLWRWRMPFVNDGGDDFDNFEKFFDAPEYTDADGNTFHKSIFFPPSGILKAGILYLAFGTGERANLRFAGDGATDADNNRFYVVKDFDPLGTEDGTLDALAVEESDLRNITNDSGCDPIVEDGYYLVAEEKEKFVTNTVIFLGDVITGSFVPAEDELDPCASGGVAFLYRFRFDCGEGAGTGGTAAENRRRAIGNGLPTAPRISVGNLDDPNCPVRLVVVTSEGKIEGDCQDPPLQPLKNIEWKQN